ncbi:zinc finger protein CONSTANS [Striga asiatica]|uniref:Zinc finger protein CONSTANS n=1 Tax=Striga asiatica TaxID=4170 RepID=A0A5A7Q5M8_STRAF|nr:zinc finger protein CONSTANS [Striga asiatica]
MGSETRSLTAKICDSCKAAPSTVFCRADSAFLCVACDANIHAANKLASRHARVLVCEVCEHAPAAVTCKADAAALCPACDRDIHSANPLARRHERLPLAPFYHAKPPADDFSEEEEAEAASWLLLPNAIDKPEESGSPEYLFADTNPYVDMDLIGDEHHEPRNRYSADGVVPVQSSKTEFGPVHYPEPVVDGFPTYEMDYFRPKPFMYNFTAQSLSQSVSSSSMEVGVVPEQTAMSEKSEADPPPPVPVSGQDRDARVLRYREKRKNRKFEKTIRYASRKAYAETRPRIKGRFAKRSDSLLFN